MMNWACEAALCKTGVPGTGPPPPDAAEAGRARPTSGDWADVDDEEEEAEEAVDEAVEPVAPIAGPAAEVAALAAALEAGEAGGSGCSTPDGLAVCRRRCTARCSTMSAASSSELRARLPRAPVDRRMDGARQWAGG